MKLKICEDKKGLYLKLTKQFIKKYGIKAGMTVSITPIDRNSFRMITNKKNFIVRKL